MATRRALASCWAKWFGEVYSCKVDSRRPPSSLQQSGLDFGNEEVLGKTFGIYANELGWLLPELQMNYRKDITGRKVVYSGFNDSIGYYGAISEQQKKMAEKWLNQFDLCEIAENSFLNLSYGQQRLFLLARAMVKSPELLLLDEPCQGA